MLVGGQETWHPNPDIFYADGAGPLLDMGPYYLTAIVALLGPVARVAGFASTRTRERTIEIGPRAGERFAVDTPSHTTAAIELESGVTANLIASFEAQGQYVCDFELHGTEGVICVPGSERVRRPGSHAPRARGLAGRSLTPRAAIATRAASGSTSSSRRSPPDGRSARRAASALHVVDVARGILSAAAEGRIVEIESRASKPEAMPVETIA